MRAKALRIATLATFEIDALRSLANAAPLSTFDAWLSGVATEVVYVAEDADREGFVRASWVQVTGRSVLEPRRVSPLFVRLRTRLTTCSLRNVWRGEGSLQAEASQEHRE